MYDCVCVINDDQAIQALSQPRCVFGEDFSYGPGPMGGSMNDSEVKQPWAPVWVYVKSKGHAIEAQVKGTAILERKDENERFYGVNGLSARQILAGEVKAPSGPASQLQEVLNAVEEQKHDSSSLPPSGKSPGDYVVKMPKEAGQA